MNKFFCNKCDEVYGEVNGINHHLDFDDCIDHDSDADHDPEGYAALLDVEQKYFWHDPDNGICSKVVKVIKQCSDFIIVSDSNGTEFQVLEQELRTKTVFVLALRVLKNMQTCIHNRDTFVPGVGDCHNKDENYRSPFNLSVSFGICWHVYAHTPPDLGLDMGFLKPVFLELGYVSDKYPVESTIYPKENDEVWYNAYDSYDKYFKDSEDSKIRCKLVDQLVEYFTDKLETL